MRQPSFALEAQDRETFGTIFAFLRKRLAEQGTIDWALKLGPRQHVHRMAIEELLEDPSAATLQEPWATAWRLIEESWSLEFLDRDDGTAIYGIQKRLRCGDHSGGVVKAIVKLVAPRLKVERLNSWHKQFIRKPRRPKTFAHVLSASLTSGELIDLSILELNIITDLQFLKSLANGLDAAVNNGLDIAQRIGWDERRSFVALGMLNRVYYTSPGRKNGEDHEPDAYHQGIAPSVKLLHAVVARIADIDPDMALPFARRWNLYHSPVHARLWAAMSRNSCLIPNELVQSFLLAINDRIFWDVNEYPEIAELRAVRFKDMDGETQNVILERIRKGPPRVRWPKGADARRVKNAQLHCIVRELQRIATAGGSFPEGLKTWIDVQLAKFPNLAAMPIDAGFPAGVVSEWLTPKPDDRYDTLEGSARLHSLDSAFSSSRGGWDSDPAERANEWLKQPEKAVLILNDFETTEDGGDNFPRVWDYFGWAHSPNQPATTGAVTRNLQDEADRVLTLFGRLSEGALTVAIEGVSHWLDTWNRQVVSSQLGLPIWLRIWPIAVEATNTETKVDDDFDLSVTARAVDEEREPMDLDTLNAPAGKLVSVFLAACPNLVPTQHAFAIGTPERQMRDAMIVAPGRSGLIAKHRLIEALHYFLQADSSWTREYLIVPLLNDDGAALALWRAIARRTQFKNVLDIIGLDMAERATDPRLGRETRQSLVFSLVIESLHAFRERRNPAVPNQRIQQMLRTLDDEVRASAANAIQQFILELSAKADKSLSAVVVEHDVAESTAALFRSAAAPFLRDVWPQERSLSTPGVSSALADLPAASGNAFVEAVETIARFLVPFDCWSMINFGLYGENGDGKKLAMINDDAKAKAFLRLLDLTVGTAENAVIPYDISSALNQISAKSPSLIDSPEYRRLATAARR